jgi:glutathione S-transferase
MCFEQTNVDGVISRAIFRSLYPDAIPTRREEFDVWWREGARTLEVLERHLQRHSFLVADVFSIADITLYAYVHRADQGGYDMRPYHALRAWFRRIEARPAYIPIDVVPC